MVPRPFFAKVFFYSNRYNGIDIYTISLCPTMTLEKGKTRESVGRKATGLSPKLKG
jgi:hypothetical protein